LEIDDEINKLCLQWVPCLSETTAEGVRLLNRNSPRSEGGMVILYA